MAKLKKVDLSGKQIGEVEISDSLFPQTISSQSVKDYIVAIRRNQRQWSANTKGRSEVKATGKKPHAQKGTGRARQGTIAAPQYRGGGIVFGPKPKFDQHIKVNKKQRRAAICYLLKEKIESGHVFVLARPTFNEPKTKAMATFLQSLQLDGKRILFIKGREAESHLSKSLRNLPKVELGTPNTFNGYNLIKARYLIALDSAIDLLIQQLEVMGS